MTVRSHVDNPVSTTTLDEYYLKLDGSNANTTIDLQAQNLINVGNVGIGNTAPQTKLHISGAHSSGKGMLRLSGTTHAMISLDTGSSSYWSGIYFSEAGTTQFQMRYNQVADALSFTSDITSQTPLVLNSDGTVGIRTSTPGKQLEINSATGDALRITYNGTANYSDFLVSSGGDLTIAPSGKDVTFDGDSDGEIYLDLGGRYGAGTQNPASTLYVQSRGQQLVTNAFGFLENIYNFDAFTGFVQDEVYAGKGSFTVEGRAFKEITEDIPVDPSKIYKGSLWAKNIVYTDTTNNRTYITVVCKDADGFTINPYHTMRYPGSTQTTLAAELKAGDTTITLTDATGWNNAGQYYQRQIMFFGYQNSYGYTYPDYTYTRWTTQTNAWVYGSTTLGAWAEGGISGNTITLRSAWVGPTFAAGTAVQNGNSGGSFKYIATPSASVAIDDTWNNLSGHIGGIDTTGTNLSYKFHPGTAFVQLGVLANYPGVSTNTTAYSAYTFSEQPDLDWRITEDDALAWTIKDSGTTNLLHLDTVNDKLILDRVDLSLASDSKKIYLGAGSDVSLNFDGSDFVINSENVTANDELHITNFDKVDIGSFSDTSENILRIISGTNLKTSIRLMELNNVYGFSIENDANNNTFNIVRHDNDATGVSALSILRTSGNVGIGTTTPSQKLDIVGNIELENTTSSDTGVIYKGTTPFLHNFKHPTGDTVIPDGVNTFVGGAGNLTMGSTATNPAHGSYNTAVGRGSLFSNTIGYYNASLGYAALQNSTTGYYNAAFGAEALRNITTGYNNSALGFRAGRYIADGVTTNTTSNNSLYLGSQTKALADGDTNEIVIGYNAIGAGSNTATLGNTSITKTILRGNVGIGTTTPSEKLEIDGNLFLNGDNDQLLLGTGKDVGFSYDGTSAQLATNLVAASDLIISCGTDKTLELSESVWNDVQFNIESGRVAAANFPDWDTTFTTNTSAYKFDVDDYIDLGTNEMPHDWKEATDVYFHVHTALDGANASGSSQYAKFTIYIAYADEGAVYTETNKDIEIEIPTGTADLTHLFGSATALAMTGLTIGTQINCRIKRIAATTGTEYPNHIFLTQVGIHYEVNTLGSRQIGTK